MNERGVRSESIEFAVELGFVGRYRPVVPPELFDESRNVSARPRFEGKIGIDELHAFELRMISVGLVLPRNTLPIPRIVSDPKDDSLLAAAKRGDADFRSQVTSISRISEALTTNQRLLLQLNLYRYY